MKRTFYHSIIAAVAALSMIACSKEPATDNKDKDPEPEPQGEIEVVTVSPESGVINERGGSVTITVMANYDWTVTGPAWVKIDPASGPGDKASQVVVISAEANKDAAREGEVVVTLPKGATASVKLSQAQFVEQKRPAAIASAADFELWMKEFAALDDAGQVMEITKDINMEGITLAAVPVYFGTLKGNGHKISNLELDHSLFDSCNGVIEGLTLDASCKLTIPTVDSEAHFGVFAGDNEGTIKGCSTAAAIGYGASQGATVYVGGIVGNNLANGTVENCTNSGNIRYASASDLGAVRLGGITANNLGVLKDCTNSGDVVFASETGSASDKFIAGITGNGKEGTITGCVNRGRIMADPQAAVNANWYIGGLMGYNTTTDIHDCKNFGDVSATPTTQKVRIAALIGWQNKVDDGKDYTMLENCVANCKVSAQCRETGKFPQYEGGNDMLSSGAMVVGRFNGQKGKSSNLHFGSEAKPIKLAGTIEFTGDPAASVVLTAANVTAYVCGGGSATNYSCDPAEPNTWQTFCVVYEDVKQ